MELERKGAMNETDRDVIQLYSSNQRRRDSVVSDKLNITMQCNGPLTFKNSVSRLRSAKSGRARRTNCILIACSDGTSPLGVVIKVIKDPKEYKGNIL